MFAKLPKLRLEAALEAVRTGRCGIHLTRAAEPHHLPSPLGGSRRAVDVVVPRCRKCHSVYHSHPEIEQDQIDMLYLEALQLWMRVYPQIKKQHADLLIGVLATYPSVNWRETFGPIIASLSDSLTGTHRAQ